MREPSRPHRPQRGREPAGAEVEARRSRALEEPLSVRLRAVDPFLLLEVRNPLHGTVYRVLLPEYPARASELCTCADFARRGLGTCKHIEAAYRWRAEHPDAEADGPRRPAGPTAPALWKEIDRRHRRPKPGPESLRIRAAGAVLYERARTRGSAP